MIMSKNVHLNDKKKIIKNDKNMSDDKNQQSGGLRGWRT